MLCTLALSLFESSKIFRYYRKCTISAVVRVISQFFAATYQFAISSYRIERASKAIPHISHVFLGAHAPIPRRINHTSAPTPFSQDGPDGRSIGRRSARRRKAAKTARVRVKRSRHASTIGFALWVSLPSVLSRARRRNSLADARGVRDRRVH